MGIRYLEGKYDGTEDKTALVDSVSGFAFGPLFDSYEDAVEFVTQADPDPRTMSDSSLEDAVVAWKQRRDELDALEGRA